MCGHANLPSQFTAVSCSLHGLHGLWPTWAAVQVECSPWNETQPVVHCQLSAGLRQWYHLTSVLFITLLSDRLRTLWFTGTTAGQISSKTMRINKLERKSPCCFMQSTFEMTFYRKITVLVELGWVLRSFRPVFSAAQVHSESWDWILMPGLNEVTVFSALKPHPAQAPWQHDAPHPPFSISASTSMMWHQKLVSPLGCDSCRLSKQVFLLKGECRQEKQKAPLHV